ncbi:MAG TPA: hypothetical protein VFO41_10705 [Alphaproteobacteria bacterium]|nr:hypothetical protein [Alphaproteobacteria bacterium]
MKTFVTGLIIASLVAVVVGFAYGYVDIPADAYFSTDAVRL